MPRVDREKKESSVLHIAMCNSLCRSSNKVELYITVLAGY